MLASIYLLEWQHFSNSERRSRSSSLKWGSLTRYSRSMVLEEEESSMEIEKGWIEEGRLYDNRRKNNQEDMKKRKNRNERLERHGRWRRKKTKSHFVKFYIIWVHLNVEKHVITLVTNMKEKVLVDRITLRNVGTKLG